MNDHKSGSLTTWEIRKRVLEAVRIGDWVTVEQLCYAYEKRTGQPILVRDLEPDL